MKISFKTPIEGLTTLHDLYPEVETCGVLVNKGVSDGIINQREWQYLIMAPSVWFDVSVSVIKEFK